MALNRTAPGTKRSSAEKDVTLNEKARVPGVTEPDFRSSKVAPMCKVENASYCSVMTRVFDTPLHVPGTRVPGSWAPKK
eukprot:1620576-Rhodomonas_salina.1